MAYREGVNQTIRKKLVSESDLMKEHAYIFSERLGILGYGPSDIPSADHHNLAHDEAEAHIAALREQQENQTAFKFEAMRRGL